MTQKLFNRHKKHNKEKSQICARTSSENLAQILIQAKGSARKSARLARTLDHIFSFPFRIRVRRGKEKKGFFINPYSKGREVKEDGEENSYQEPMPFL